MTPRRVPAVLAALLLTLCRPDPPAIESGKYITIWRKQADGTWKVVVHAGITD